MAKPIQGPALLRPFKPGERRPNADGSYSTEISMTAQDPSGQWMNFPSLWMGPNGPVQFQSEDDALQAAQTYEGYGSKFPRFGTLSEAEAAAKTRSNDGGVDQGELAAPVKPDLARIKNNVRKMVTQGAPETDIDGYIASEGVSIDDVRNYRAPPPMSMGEDVARSAATGAREGAESTVGQFGDAANFQGDIASWVAGKMGASPETQATVKTWGSRLHPFAMLPSTDQLRAGVTDPAVKAAGAEDVLAHDPQTVAGDYARTGAQFLPAAATPGGMVRKTASVAVPALLSETAGQLTEGSGWEPYARFLGALTGGIATVPKAPKGGPRTTVPELEAAGNAAYKASEDAGVVINQTGMRTLAKNIIDDLTEHGFDPANEPGAVPALKRIAQNANGNVTLKGLDTIRKVASNGYVAGNKSNNAAISKIINRIDELVANEDPATMAGLDTETGVKALKDARKYWHQARKLETVEKFGVKGRAIGNSQINQDVEGATRRQVRTLLTNESKARGFTKEELKAAEKAASMTTGQRAMRVVSGMFPQGQLGGMLHGGAGFAGLASLLTGNPVPLMLQGTGMVVGYGAKKAEEALSKRAYQEFVDLIANGKPAVKTSIPKRLSKPEEIARLLMLGHQSSAGAPMRSPVEELNR